MSDTPSPRQCTMPTCEEEALEPAADGSLCAMHQQQATGNETDLSEDASLDAATIREHYKRARPALEAVGALDPKETVQSLGNYDYHGWYETRPETSVEAIEAGYDLRGRVFGLIDDYSLVTQAIDRVLYSTISYTETDAIAWNAYQQTDKGKDWQNDYKPTPEYGDLAGYAPFADIDLADEYKERPLPEEKQKIVERTIAAYIEEFSQLAGAGDSVFALDSVGGAYVLISPQTTAPIATHYDGDDRKKVYEALAGRVNDWLGEVRERVNERIPQAEGLFEPDFLNNKNRLYKAPLSIHKSINGIVHPLDTEAVDYEFVPVSDTDDELVSEVEAWGEAFTDDTHQTALDEIVTTLWDEYDGDGWQAILNAWLDDVEARERERIHARARREKRQRERRTELADAMDDDADIDDIIAHQNVTPAKQDVFDALDRIDVRDVIRRYACNAWDTSNRSHETTFDPNWRNSSSGMSCAVPENENRFIDNGENAGGRAVKAFALGRGHLSDAGQRLRGRDYWRVVDEMRDEGFDIPHHIPDAGTSDGQTPYWAIVKAAVALEICDRDDLTEREASDGSTYRALPDDSGETFTATLEALEDAGIEHGRDPDEEQQGGTPVSALPLAQLDALEPEERRRAARKRGHEWPTTDDARERLFQTITEVMAEGDDRVIDAPTSLGKSHTIATTPWDAPQFDDVTGEQPVIHLSKTTDARDEAVEKSQNADVDHFVLLGRHDACPCARGDHDPHECEDEDRQPITINGESISEWMDHQCDVKGLPFSVAHSYARENNDQGVELPCCDESECYSTRQWDEYRENDYRLIHATHNFAFVPGLRAYKNIVFDEEPDFTQELTTERVREAIGAYLRAIDAPVQSWEQFISMSLFEDAGGDAGRAKQQLKHSLDDVPDREWFVKHPDAHILAPALARAIFNAEDRGNERRVGKTPYEPPRLDANISDDDGWNREWVSVVLDAENDIETVRVVPGLNMARSVIGMDAHPAIPVWQANTLPHIKKREVLDAEERRLWRRYERGLRVVQVGDATRPLASEYAAEEYVNETALAALLEHIRDEYDGFRTAITTNAVEDTLREMMDDVGINAPETMHYGEEKSRNDFADENVGFVNGCIDPGDDHIINLLAELDLDAEPALSEEDCEHCAGSGCNQCLGEGKARAHGRGFEGDDAETAAEILASVRENHTAQSAGRYARNPDNPQDAATVFVRTDAMPAGFADVQVPGVVWAYGDKQQQLAEHLRGHPQPISAKDAAAEIGCSKQHAYKTLKRWAEDGTVQAIPGAGHQGATLYSESGLPTTGVAELGDQVTNPRVWDNRTYQFATCDPTAAHIPSLQPARGDDAIVDGNMGDQTTLDWADAVDDRGDQT